MNLQLLHKHLNWGFAARMLLCGLCLLALL
jgi:hypothetical protein